MSAMRQALVDTEGGANVRTDGSLIPVAYADRMDSPLWDCLIPRTGTDLAIRTGTKRCRSCGEVKPLDAYHRHPTCIAGRQSRCKACRNAQDRKEAA